MNYSPKIYWAAMIFTVASACAPALGDSASPFIEHGQFHADVRDGKISLQNDWIAAAFSTAGNHLKPISLPSSSDGSAVPMNGEAFELVMSDGTLVAASQLTLVGTPRGEDATLLQQSPKLSDRIPGKSISAEMEDSAHTLHVTWTAIGRDGGNYLREDIVVTPLAASVPLRKIVMFEGTLKDAKLSGPEKGPVVVAGNWFVGLEHPISHASIKGDEVECDLSRAIDLNKGQTQEASVVLGLVRSGQMRRDFQSYVQRERAHPYRPFLHYNTWYDLGYFNRYTSDDLVKTIDTFGEELTRKRGVILSSFLMDDGWDSPTTLWDFTASFPDKLVPAREAAAKYNAAPGIWLSPWGGYGKPHKQRLEAATTLGFEHNERGPILSGPKYYDHFRDVCLDLIKNGGVNQFKFDGTGNAANWFPGSKFGSDFEAAISLIGELRAAKPDLFINLTTGTWPSPFWTRYADSIWRGGEDHSFAGVGSYRQQWITYRDADTYEEIASASPLYPLNSLMLHGLIYAKHAKHLDSDPNQDFNTEVHSYFGTGTQLQEMYISPSLLTNTDWDVLAEAANWSRANAATLIDTHWIGGDPKKLEVYGWGAWSPEKGIITLRNPSDKPATYSLDVSSALELPDNAPRHFKAHSPWKDQQDQPALELSAGKHQVISLQPFEVINLEAVPMK